jgi:Tfp pilus assembly protein PilX
MKVNKTKNDRGFVLVLTLVTMVSMTIIGISLVTNMNVDMQLSRNEREAKQAFQLSDAGIQEAISRLHLATSNARYIGELAGDANYRAAGWNADDSKNFGVGVGGNRNSVDDLSYSVTIRYLDETNPEGFCDSNEVGPNTTGNSAVPPGGCSNTTAELVMYGQDFNINSTVTNITRGKQPVYRIVSTGTSNNTSRTIETYIGASSLNTDTEYGLNTNTCIDANGVANNLGTVLQGPGCGCDPQITGACAPNKTAAQVTDDYDMNEYLGPQLSEVINLADEKHQCLNGTCSAPLTRWSPTGGILRGTPTPGSYT